VVFLILLHLSYIGLGLCWADTQKRNDVEKLSSIESVFKHWAIGVFFVIIVLYLASFLHLYWVFFGMITLLGLGNLVKCWMMSGFFQELYDCYKMPQGRTAARRIRYSEKLGNLTPILIILSASIFVFILNGNLSFNHQVHCVSGMGNWALKSKIVFLESGLHASYFEHATHYGKFSYPPGLPLLNAPLFLIHGSDHDLILKLNSTLIFTGLFAFLSSLFMLHWKWFSLPAIVLLLGFFLGDAAWSVSYWFYSEPLLILLCAISTMLFFRSATRSALIAAAGASMIKQEGVLFLILIGILCVLFCKERKQVMFYFAVSLLPYFSWKIICSFHGINDSDFDFTTANFHPEHLTQAYKALVECAFTKWESYSGAFALLPVGIVYGCITKNWRMLSVLSIPLLLIVCYLAAISFSTIEDIDWHLSATTRYLMLPAVIIFVSLSVLPMRSKASVKNKQ
jgi:hypothetical protein